VITTSDYLARPKLFAGAGLKRTATDIAYLTKIALFEKPMGCKPRVRKRR
jgi:hypothetical protein